MIALLPKSALANVVIGAAAVVTGPAVLRPVVVGIVRVGYQVKDYATSAWTRAKNEAATVRAEARVPSDASAMEAQIQQLRSEVNALKAARKPA